MKENREHWKITLEPLPWDVPSELRVRTLLKVALRTCRMKCIEVVKDDVAVELGEPAVDVVREEPPF